MNNVLPENLQDVKVINGNLFIHHNDSSLLDLSYFRPTEIRGDIIIDNNEGLTTLDFLENVTSFSGLLLISYNNNLEDITLPNSIEEIKILKILNNNSLVSINLGRITNINGYVVIKNNHSLTTITTTSNINITEFVNICNNSSLNENQINIFNLTENNEHCIVIGDHNCCELNFNPGWNLVSIEGNESKSIHDNNITEVWEYENNGYKLIDNNEIILEPTKGYFIYYNNAN